MVNFRARKSGTGQHKIRTVPIVVTPEGFWCCTSQVMFQNNNPKNQNNPNKRNPSPVRPPSPPYPQPRPTSSLPQEQPKTLIPKTATVPLHYSPLRPRGGSKDQGNFPTHTSTLNPTNPIGENQERKISVGFGQPETSDLKVVLSVEEGISIILSVHRNILSEKSSFFADRLCRESPPITSLGIENCEDVEIYIETVGLMYCVETKLRLIKQSVPRVLRILKVAESLGYDACIKSCLEYLEAVPWVGEEEDLVISSLKQIKCNNNHGISLILKRVLSDVSNPPKETLTCILKMVLESNDERARHEMKPLVLKLLKEGSVNGPAPDLCSETLYDSCQTCLNSLVALFRQAAKPGFTDHSSDRRESISQQVALEADNLLWLLEILAARKIADDFVLMWSRQDELAKLHLRLPTKSRHLISCVTARLFVGIGRGELLLEKETRLLLLNVWLQPLINDYCWLQHGCRAFDRKLVEEGIGRTILTLPLDDQQGFLLSWLGIFLKDGDNCPNLQRAFEVWWRRTFIRPYAGQLGNSASAL